MSKRRIIWKLLQLIIGGDNSTEEKTTKHLYIIMIKEIKDIKNYQLNPILETNVNSYNHTINLFDKAWLFQNDYWMKHIHIKVNDACNANCPFCIEKNSHLSTNWERLYYNVAILLKQMSDSKDLCTVSITGGEPSTSPKHVAKLIDLIKQYDCFLTMNTNFHSMVLSTKALDWINISRHCIGADTYCGLPILNFKAVQEYKILYPTTKIRIQCVLHPRGLRNVQDFIDFVKYYSKIADDISIRRLITVEGTSIDNNDLFAQIKEYCYNNAQFVEQVLKDYYVYETWNILGTNVTFSHSNMALLKQMEQVEPDNLVREIVVHPDGLVSGSWYRNKKIIEF